MSLTERLQRMLASPPPTNLIEADLAEGIEGPLTPAAVLVAITRSQEPGVLLTIRREHMRTHPGQIAFPGGRIDPEDKHPEAAALREAQEELGLAPAAVTLWGTADPYRTVTGYHVTPVLGEIDPDPSLKPHPEEVADWFEAPLAFLLDPSNQRLVEAKFRGSQRSYYEIVWQQRRIWGATAAIIVNLSRRLSAT